MKNKITEKLFTLIYTDPMTGVKNRNAYEEELDQLRRKNIKLDNVMVIAVEITNLKTINESYGNRTGDEIIKTVAKCLIKTIGTKSDVYRISSKEFMCITEKDVLGYISEFRDLISFENSGRKIPFIVSIGYMKFDVHTQKTIDDLIIGCDAKMCESRKK